MSEAKDDYSAGDPLLVAQVNTNAENINDAGGFRDNIKAGETINGGTLPVAVYQSAADNELYACDGNDTAKLEFIGFAISNSTNGVVINFQGSGIVRGFTGLTEGTRYYVQDDKTIGTSKGTYEIFVGIAISETELVIMKDARNPLVFATTSVFSGTAPTSFTDLDLSAVVGANQAVCLLKVLSTGSDPNGVVFRKNGDTSTFVVSKGASGFDISNAEAGYVVVVTDASGIVEWLAGTGEAITITMEAYLRI